MSTANRSHLPSTIASNVAAMGMAVISSAILARALGPTGRGEFAAIQVLPTMIASVGAAGIPTAVGFFAGKTRDNAPEVVATAWCLAISLAIVVAAISVFLLPVLMAGQRPLVIATARWYLVVGPLLAFANVPFNALQGVGHLRIWNVMRLQFPAMWCIVAVVSWAVFPGNAAMVAYGYLLALLIQGLSWTAILRLWIPGRYRPSSTHVVPLLRYGSQVLFTQLPQSINLRVDQAIIAAVLLPADLGLYAVAVAWSGLLNPVLTALAQVILPALVNLPAERQADALGSATRQAIVTTAVVGCGVAALTPLTLPLVYGAAFGPAVSVGLLMIIATSINSMNAILAEGLRAMGRPRWPMFGELAASVVTIAMLYLLLKPLGIRAAALASIASAIVSMTILVVGAIRVSGRSLSLFLPTTNDINRIALGLRGALLPQA